MNGIIRSWNRGAQRIFGYTPEEIIGRHISTLAVPERVDEIPDILARLAQGERVDHYQTKRQDQRRPGADHFAHRFSHPGRARESS